MGIHGTVKPAYLALGDALTNNRLLDYKWFLEQEVDSWKRWVGLPMRQRLWLWRRGFISPAAQLYDFETYGPEAYLSRLQKFRLYRSANGSHRYLIDDKLSQHWMMADYPEHRPEVFGLLDRGRVHGVAGATLEGDPVPVDEWLPSALREHSRIVLKQLRGKGGKEVVVCEYDDGFFFDGEPVTEAALCEAMVGLSSYLVTEYVGQHAYADDLYPHAANTIRMLTMWDDEAAELIMAGSVHRIGTHQSRPIDNFSAGGVAAEIDRETGELGRATQLPTGGDLPWYTTHPDTSSQIEGVYVPQWDAVRSTIGHIARDNTNIPILGWDVLINESGEPIVLEANTGTAVRTFQVHRPLLADSRVADVVSRYLQEVVSPTVPRRTAARSPVH